MIRRAPARPLAALFAAFTSAALFSPIVLSVPHAAYAAQLPVPVEKAAVGCRMPALSPDGKRLAFVWRGDVWVSEAICGPRSNPRFPRSASPIFPRSIWPEQLR